MNMPFNLLMQPRDDFPSRLKNGAKSAWDVLYTDDVVVEDYDQ